MKTSSRILTIALTAALIAAPAFAQKKPAAKAAETSSATVLKGGKLDRKSVV